MQRALRWLCVYARAVWAGRALMGPFFRTPTPTRLWPPRFSGKLIFVDGSMRPSASGAASTSSNDAVRKAIRSEISRLPRDPFQVLFNVKRLRSRAR
eukprot:3206241-Prymnesium_polylepis.1